MPESSYVKAVERVDEASLPRACEVGEVGFAEAGSYLLEPAHCPVLLLESALRRIQVDQGKTEGQW
mgnify:CR=1 FL=1